MEQTSLRNTAAVAVETDIRWEWTRCPLCDEDDFAVEFEGVDSLSTGKRLRFAVVRCRSCGLHYTNPRPDAASIGRFYPPDYLPHQPPQDDDPRKWCRRYPFLPRWVTSYSRNRRLLDFGCGGGAFLERMRRLGWEVVGLDASAETVDRLRRDHGIDAIAGSLPNPRLSPSTFDLVTMWHSLEHVHRPREVLQAAREVIVPGGMLIVAVPNMQSLAAMWFRENWYGLDVPRHLTHFTPRTLAELLRRCGFRLLRVRQTRHSSWLRKSARVAYWRGAPGVVRSTLLATRFFSRAASWLGAITGRADEIVALATRPALGD